MKKSHKVVTRKRKRWKSERNAKKNHKIYQVGLISILEKLQKCKTEYQENHQGKCFRKYTRAEVYESPDRKGLLIISQLISQ